MAQEIARVARRLEEAKETKFLDLSKCELLSIPDATYLMLKNSVTEKCDLSYNKIKKITSKFCSKFPVLKELCIVDNNLTSLPDDLQELKELTVLDISHNKFDSLPSVIYDCTKLTTIIASYNKITYVDVERLGKMESLKTIDLRDNPLTTNIIEDLQTLEQCTVYVGDSDPVGKELDELE
ncbi:Leucine rich repeat [Mactra antiquata]